jgi:hypothetical protein
LRRLALLLRDRAINARNGTHPPRAFGFYLMRVLPNVRLGIGRDICDVKCLLLTQKGIP